MYTDKINKIMHYEKHLDMLKKGLQEDNIATLFEQYESYEILKSYYESDIWKEDYYLDEQNAFPPTLKRGVLAQDELYNTLENVENILTSFMHTYAYTCGVIDAFCEVVKAGVKDLALSHPTSKEEIVKLLPYAKMLCKKYNISCEVEHHLLISDLFPYSANKGKSVILFYKKQEIIDAYHQLKQAKQDALLKNTYDTIREDIAYCFGKLLSYSDDSIYTYIKTNKEKES